MTSWPLKSSHFQRDFDQSYHKKGAREKKGFYVRWNTGQTRNLGTDCDFYYATNLDYASILSQR